MSLYTPCLYTRFLARRRIASYLNIIFFYVCIRTCQVCIYVFWKFVYVLFGVYTSNVKRTYTRICTSVFAVLKACIRAHRRVYTLYMCLYTRTQMYVYARGICEYTCRKACICTFKMSVYMFVYDNRLFCMRDIESLYTPAHTRIQTLAHHVYKQDQICIRNLQCLSTRTQTRRQGGFNPGFFWVHVSGLGGSFLANPRCRRYRN